VTLSQAGAVIAILAGAVIVLGGLVALVRSIWGVAQTLRDNTKATKELSGQLHDLTTSIDGRFDQLAERVTRLEARK
jgi:predicted PurR-regulated permease PerM